MRPLSLGKRTTICPLFSNNAVRVTKERAAILDPSRPTNRVNSRPRAACRGATAPPQLGGASHRIRRGGKQTVKVVHQHVMALVGRPLSLPAA